MREKTARLYYSEPTVKHATLQSPLPIGGDLEGDNYIRNLFATPRENPNQKQRNNFYFGAIPPFLPPHPSSNGNKSIFF